MPGETMHAATAVLLREGDRGIEILMVRRDSRIVFAGGHWVFPGGRVEDEDRADAPDEIAAARRAAVRETREEAGLTVDIDTLIPLSHWTPPDIAPRRYLTWFFLAAAPSGHVRIDEHEIRDHAWMRPREALDRRNQGEIELSPPTWVTLEHLATRGNVAEALQAARRAKPERFTTRIASSEKGPIALWEGDAGYEASDANATGPRHRLSMVSDGWRYERS